MRPKDGISTAARAVSDRHVTTQPRKKSSVVVRERAGAQGYDRVDLQGQPSAVVHPLTPHLPSSEMQMRGLLWAAVAALALTTASANQCYLEDADATCAICWMTTNGATKQTPCPDTVHTQWAKEAPRHHVHGHNLPGAVRPDAGPSCVRAHQPGE